MSDFKGEVAALCAAFLWAVSSVIYGRLGQRIPPLELNLLKGAIAIALLVLTLFLRGDFLSAIAPTTLCLLLLSGVLGIAILTSCTWKHECQNRNYVQGESSAEY